MPATETATAVTPDHEAERIAARLSPAQIKAVRDRQIGTGETRRSTCAALCSLGLFRPAGGGYVGQSRSGRSRYAEHVYNRTDLGARVAAVLAR